MMGFEDLVDTSTVNFEVWGLDERRVDDCRGTFRWHSWKSRGGARLGKLQSKLYP
jgi:hypothetical protein